LIELHPQPHGPSGYGVFLAPGSENSKKKSPRPCGMGDCDKSSTRLANGLPAGVAFFVHFSFRPMESNKDKMLILHGISSIHGYLPKN
jgi:hypothetical protein